MAAQITAVHYFPGYCLHSLSRKKFHGTLRQHSASVATLILVFGVCMHSSTALFETLNFQSFTSVDFWRAGAEATESIKRNQLADNYFHLWHE